MHEAQTAESSSTAEIDLESAYRFVEALTGDRDTPMTWQTFEDPDKSQGKRKRIKHKFKNLSRILHGPLKIHHRRLTTLNQVGAAVTLCVNETDLEGRTRENIVSARALWADSDRGPFPENLAVPPNIRVKTWQGEHLYWLLRPGEPLGGVEAALADICRTLKSDDTVLKSCQVMRVPGFLHHKTERPLNITFRVMHSGRHAIDEVLMGLGTRKDLPPIERARRYLDKIPAAIEGENGDDHTFKAACALGDFGLEMNEALGLLSEWNQRCVPPWPEDDLSKKVVNAFKYRKYPAGSKLDASVSPKNAPIYLDVANGPSPGEIEAHEETDGSDAPVFRQGYGGLTPQGRFGKRVAARDLGFTVIDERDIACTGKKQIYEYNGAWWEEIEQHEIKGYITDLDGHRYTTEKRRNEGMNYILSHPRVIRSKIDWNQLRPNEIALADKVVDAVSGRAREHDKDDWLDKCLPHKLNSAAECPTWLYLLYDWFTHDPEADEKIAAIQEFMGYILLNHARYKKALVLWGPSNTGKSVVAGIIRRLVGFDNVCAIPLDKMDDAMALHPIFGSMVNLVTEISDDHVMADGGFKQLVATEEPITINPKYAKPFLYEPTTKHVFCTNNLPHIRDISAAVYNRLLIIKFDRIYRETGDEDACSQDGVIDQELEERAWGEMPGILAWAVEGARRLVASRGRFTTPPSMKQLMEEYRESNNPIEYFLKDHLERSDDPDALISIRDVYDRFVEATGSQMKRNRFTRVCTGLGYERRKGEHGYYFTGARWKDFN